MAEGQLSTREARVVDAPITAAARGYNNPMPAWPYLFPVVPVGARGGRIIRFRAEDFNEVDLRRSPGATVQRVDVGFGSDPFALVQRAIEVPVPIETAEEAAAVPNVNLGNVAGIRGRRIVDFQIELEAAKLATADASYKTENRKTLAAEAQWSHADSTPQRDVQAAKKAIRQGIGLNPDTLVVGAEVNDALVSNPDVNDRIKHTMGPSEKKPVVTPELLAAYFGVKNYVVGECMKGEPGAFEHVWGKFAILAYSETSDLASMGSPSFAYTYRLGGYPVVEQPYYDETVRSWIYPYISEDTPVVTGEAAAFLFKNVVQ